MTKRIHLYALALLAAMVSLTSCTDGASSSDSITPTKHEVTLAFDLSIEAQTQTRAAGNRELTSSDDWQRVSCVRVFMFRSDTEAGTYTYYKPTLNGSPIDYIYASDFGGKAAGQSGIWGDDEPNWEEHEMVITGMELIDGWYKLVAIARDDIDGDNDAGATWTFNALTVGTTTINDLTAMAASDGLVCGELFVGSNTAKHITSGVRLHETIVMERVVAGVLMYVENIATTINSTAVKSIAIIRRKHTSQLALMSATASGTVHTFVSDGASLLNEQPAAKDIVVRYDIPGGAATSNGYYVNINDNGSTAHPNAICRGAFVTPQDVPTADCTLNFVYLDASDNILKSMDVKLTKNNGVDVTPTKLYPLVANHIYEIGSYRKSDDTDEPIDLGELPDDVIVVHGSWQADVNIEM